MHVPADTAVAETPSVPACGGAVPRQFGSIAALLLPPPPPPLSKRTSTPFDPAARILASRSCVSQPGLGCGSVMTPPELVSATAAPGPAPRTNTSTRPAPTTSFLMLLPLRFRLWSAQRMTFRARPFHHATTGHGPRHRLRGRARLGHGAGLTRGSPLPDSNRRPLPYHGSPRASSGSQESGKSDECWTYRTRWYLADAVTGPRRDPARETPKVIAARQPARPARR